MQQKCEDEVFVFKHLKQGTMGRQQGSFFYGITSWYCLTYVVICLEAFVYVPILWSQAGMTCLVYWFCLVLWAKARTMTRFLQILRYGEQNHRLIITNILGQSYKVQKRRLSNDLSRIEECHGSGAFTSGRHTLSPIYFFFFVQIETSMRLFKNTNNNHLGPLDQKKK